MTQTTATHAEPMDTPVDTDPNAGDRKEWTFNSSPAFSELFFFCCFMLFRSLLSIFNCLVNIARMERLVKFWF